ncbi:CLUMA_CG011130, isoform A [Clunio marinus]|uniref:CLUMA_CG011130, isoform A n=1 Tax=Clunio marinus TaxID=568069 RepID=A0A1J1IFH1_9DIPT|nr:CLUMA_CG011130, isoform A [Clunio marinus]
MPMFRPKANLLSFKTAAFIQNIYFYLNFLEADLPLTSKILRTKTILKRKSFKVQLHASPQPTKTFCCVDDEINRVKT